jgi:gas vesicle protein
VQNNKQPSSVKECTAVVAIGAIAAGVSAVAAAPQAGRVLRRAVDLITGK